jgi:anti-anti-sigma factor
MKIRETMIGDVAILSVSGQITSGPDVAPLKVQIQSLVKVGVTEVVVDLAEMEWIGSAMIGVLVSGFVTTRAVGGELRLVGGNKKIAEVLRVTKLNTVFHTGGKTEEAVKNAMSLSVTKPGPFDRHSDRVLKVAV